MARELLLLRHGKSSSNTGDADFDRPLTDRGKRAAQRVGVYLATNDKVPDYVISSPAVRALVTAEKSLKAMGQGSAGIVQNRTLYLADSETLLEIIRQVPEDVSRLMIVGHNPGLERLLTSLAGHKSLPGDGGKRMPTATLAVLETDSPWSKLGPGKASLAKLIRPRSLPKKFPWPLMEAKEQRDRPAYYYNQSSVIPYRIRQGELDILVIRSSKKKHWVVPKGIHEPGLNVEESAAREALEEAGVRGVVEKPRLGRYDYEKWGATCVVDVFAMSVEHVIPEADWEESHRTRQWVSPDKAVKLVRQPELGPMIQELAKRMHERAISATDHQQG